MRDGTYNLRVIVTNGKPVVGFVFRLYGNTWKDAPESTKKQIQKQLDNK